MKKEMTNARNVLVCAMLVIGLLAQLRIASAEVEEGQRPDFSINALDGTQFQLSSLEGSVVLVDFWATWCEPCAASLEFYRGLVERYADQGLVIVAVSVDEDRDTLQRYVEREQLPFVIVWDAEHQVVSVFEPPTMPTSYLLNSSGVVVSTHVGFREGDGPFLEAEIVDLLAEDLVQTSDSTL